MRFPFKAWRDRHLRLLRQERAAAENEHTRRRIEAQWPAVLEAATWARETRQANHLTEKFFDFRGGRS